TPEQISAPSNYDRNKTEVIFNQPKSLKTIVLEHFASVHAPREEENDLSEHLKLEILEVRKKRYVSLHQFAKEIDGWKIMGYFNHELINAFNDINDNIVFDAANEVLLNDEQYFECPNYAALFEKYRDEFAKTEYWTLPGVTLFFEEDCSTFFYLNFPGNSPACYGTREGWFKFLFDIPSSPIYKFLKLCDEQRFPDREISDDEGESDSEEEDRDNRKKPKVEVDSADDAGIEKSEDDRDESKDKGDGKRRRRTPVEIQAKLDDFGDVFDLGDTGLTVTKADLLECYKFYLDRNFDYENLKYCCSEYVTRLFFFLKPSEVQWGHVGECSGSLEFLYMMMFGRRFF
ncbi:hypothetical protein HK098_005758, partial [Nowakowskiella sp. JEL0407]